MNSYTPSRQNWYEEEIAGPKLKNILRQITTALRSLITKEPNFDYKKCSYKELVDILNKNKLTPIDMNTGRFAAAIKSFVRLRDRKELNPFTGEIEMDDIPK